MSDSSSINPARGQNDPGWNDPPKLQYNSSSQSGKTKLNLSKRIAFPLHGSNVNTSKPTAVVQPSPSSIPLTTLANIPNAQQQPPVAIVPPMPQANPPPLQQRALPIDSAIRNQTQPLVQNQDDDNIELNENTREYCLNIFQKLICKIKKSTNVKSDDVHRRINLMNQMWLSGTLTSSIHLKLLRIAEALETNNFNEAIENHRALVVDHSNLCAAWGAALRQIILTIQDTSITTDSNNSHTTQSGNILVPTTITSNSDISVLQSQS